MAERIPGTEWRPFSPSKSRIQVVHDIGCAHTMVGSSEGSWAWNNRPGGAYAHGYTDGAGRTIQGQLIGYRAAANLQGNPYVGLALETEDVNPRYFPTWSLRCGDVPPWTDAQEDEIARIFAWYCTRFKVPPVLIPDTRRGRRGLGYHRQGISPYLVSGGLRWSNAAGKCCPDWRRINQWQNEVVPEVARRVSEATEPREREDDDDMFIADCKGKPALVVAGPNQVMKINNAQRSALRASGVRAKLIDTKHHDALVSLDDRGNQLRKIVDDVIAWHKASGTFSGG